MMRRAPSLVFVEANLNLSPDKGCMCGSVANIPLSVEWQ